MFKFIPDTISEDHNSEIKTIEEEKWNMISHGIGLLLFILCTPYLVYRASQNLDLSGVVGVGLFCFSLIMLYSASTFYHSVYREKLRARLRVFDHVSIYFLIAGSYSPFVLAVINTDEGYMVLMTLWTMTFVGSILKLFYTHRFNLLSTLIYLFMGWMAIFIIEPITQLVPPYSLIWIMVGGAFYTLGVVFYLWDRLKYNHVIWHFFVLGGSISHVIAVDGII